jgi:hypothetical protein
VIVRSHCKRPSPHDGPIPPRSPGHGWFRR